MALSATLRPIHSATAVDWTKTLAQKSRFPNKTTVYMRGTELQRNCFTFHATKEPLHKRVNV
eukprot:6492386-Amphidinium_carterae.2